MLIFYCSLLKKWLFFVGTNKIHGFILKLHFCGHDFSWVLSLGVHVQHLHIVNWHSHLSQLTQLDPDIFEN